MKTLEDRFWSKVARKDPEDCWEWQAHKLRGNGYGQFGVRGKLLYAHRVAFMLTNGTIPKGLFVLHKCDNRPCVNPNHLFLGTLSDNMVDAVRKGRQVSPRKLGPQEIEMIEELVTQGYPDSALTERFMVRRQAHSRIKRKVGLPDGRAFNSLRRKKDEE